jgi:uncharacterized protein
MSGILSIPKTGNNFPIIILVHGSGIHDKDESIGQNKPFKTIAHEMAKKGIACIRYDKRSEIPKVFDSIHPMQSMIIEDVLSAIDLAKKIENIDTSRIVVVGHSLGAMLSPMIAAQSKDVKAIILLAGNARPLEDLILEQSKYLVERDGITKDEKKEIIKIKKQVASVKNLGKVKKLNKNELPLGLSISSWQELNAYHQTIVAQSISQPMLVLQGERDYQVSMIDYKLWQSQLKTKSNVYFKSFPGLNHLFCAGTSKSYPDEYFSTCDFNMEVVDLMAFWILNNFKNIDKN